MNVIDFFQEYDFHDSGLNKAILEDNKNQLFLDIDLCNWRQKWFQEGDPEIRRGNLIFSDILDFKINKSLMPQKSYVILKVNCAQKKSHFSLKFILLDEVSNIATIKFTAESVKWNPQ